MTGPIAPYLYTEARLNIEPTFPGATLHIPTQASGSVFSPRKRARNSDNPRSQDEETYAKKHLATEGSLFFRHRNRSPRSFVWRVLDDRKLLEIQCVDLVQERKTSQESVLTYAITFEHSIRPNGVAFADPEELDALEIFVLTTGNELYTLSLRKDVLLKSAVPAAEDFDPASCFKCYMPSSFSFRHPYKLVATSSLELFLSLHDGGLMRLDRKPGDNGSHWRETFFSEGSWTSSFRGIIPWKGHNTVRFHDVDLEHNTAASIAPSPDKNHILTVTLDHTLKAWNGKTGKVGVQTDILGENHNEPQQTAQYLMNPSQGTLMQVTEVEGQPDGDAYYIVTNSPKDHQFKFWAVRDADSSTHGIRDVQPDIKLLPPIDELMNTNVWQLADFHVQPGPGWRNTSLWIRARSGAICRTFVLEFDLLAPTDDLEDAWKNNWVAVDDESLTIEQLMKAADYPSESPIASLGPVTSTNQWLSFLFYPGRLSAPMLETALYIYKKGLNLLKASAQKSDAEKPLKERLCAAITGKVGLERNSDGQLDYIKHEADVAAQWHVFFGLVRHLHSRRGDSLSLAFDSETGLAWHMRADQVCPIRTCSELEVLQLNEHIFTSEDDAWMHDSLPLARYLPDDKSVGIARLIAAAATFRSSLSREFQEGFHSASSADSLKVDSEIPDDHADDTYNVRLQALYERTEIAQEVSDDEFNKLTDSMQDLGGLGELGNDLFLDALERLGATSRGVDDEQALTRYGDRTTIRGAQEALQRGHGVLLDLLALVVFMAGDLEPEELSPDFKPSELYMQIMRKLKEYQVLIWLATNVREEPRKHRRQSNEGALDASQDSKAPVEPTLTLFESIFIGDWQSMRFPNDSMSALITYWCQAWTFGPQLATAYSGVTAHIVSNLLKHGNVDLASDFLRFLPWNPWTCYLKARLYLAIREYTFASEYFRQAAEEVSLDRFNVATFDTSALLSPNAHGSFGQGLPRYYLHVAHLFETARLHSYTADFATLALDHHIEENESINDSSIADLDRRKRSMHGSPAAMKVDLAVEEIRLLRFQELKEEILGRLFNASLQSARYEQAFNALVQFGNPALRKASLQSLLQSLLSANQTNTLLTLPFPTHLLPDVDAILLTLARKHLAFAPSSSTNPSSSTPTPQYHQILYAWRIRHSDFRGAAQILFERLQRLKTSSAKVFEPDDETLVQCYLMLINTLACCGADEGWILAEPVEGAAQLMKEGKIGKGARGEVRRAKRRIVTLEDVRREYQAELDRRSEIVQGRFAFGVGGGEAMDVL